MENLVPRPGYDILSIKPPFLKNLRALVNILVRQSQNHFAPGVNPGAISKFVPRFNNVGPGGETVCPRILNHEKIPI